MFGDLRFPPHMVYKLGVKSKARANAHGAARSTLWSRAKSPSMLYAIAPITKAEGLSLVTSSAGRLKRQPVEPQRFT